jgi:hypothetical protein
MADTQPPKLSPAEATRRIRLILEEGTIEYSFHCLNVRMPQRGVDTLDVEHVLAHGQVIREPEWSDEHNDWKYRVEGADVEGDELVAITVIIDVTFTDLVVTVF